MQAEKDRLEIDYKLDIPAGKCVKRSINDSVSSSEFWRSIFTYDSKADVFY